MTYFIILFIYPLCIVFIHSIAIFYLNFCFMMHWMELRSQFGCAHSHTMTIKGLT